MKTMFAPPQPTDLELLALARTGDRDAYGQLVSRHQTLVTSIAYSICGDFARSQDIAQDAFISAWRQLASLEDAAKFKAWLGGITRNLGNNFVRQQGRRPDRSDAPLEAPAESIADTLSPHDHAVTREEALIVWRALEELPETYREPLILFYREHHSVERVATALDLSEDTVKQRLSRGRGLLRDQVENLVERSLGFTTPGAMFTTAVLSALPIAATQIAAAAVGSAAKTSVGAKIAASIAGLSATLTLLPLFNIAGSWFAGRELVRQARNRSERTFLKRMAWVSGVFSAVSVIGMVALHHWENARRLREAAQIQRQLDAHLPLQLPTISETQISTLPFLVATTLCLAAAVAASLWGGRRYLEIYRNWLPPETVRRRRFILHFYPSRALNYRSKFTAFGLPLIDLRFGSSPEEPLIRGTARGWIAMGDIAHGVVFALGGFATGGIALGGIAVGVVSIGGLSFGLLALGVVALGGVADAFLLAIGYEALAVMLGIGFEAATGVAAVAKHIASDAVFAIADHVGDSTARRWSETGLVPWIFEATIYPRMFLAMFAWILISAMSYTVVARYPRKSTLEAGRSQRLFDRSWLLPSFLGALLVVPLLGVGLNVAEDLNARRLIAEQDALVSRAREAVLHAPNEEARVQARFELGKTLVQTGRPEAALAEFLWCLDEGAVHAPKFYWTRLTTLLPEIGRLSDAYPSAKGALTERRDRVQSVFPTGRATENSVDEIVALNRSLHQSNRSLALYEQLPAADPLRPVLSRYLRSQLQHAQREEEAQMRPAQ